MQLRQKYTINNVTYENEMFISEKDNANIYSLMINFFLNCSVALPVNAKQIKTTETKDEQPAKTEEKSATDENNNTVVTVPVEHEEKETDVNVNVEKKQTNEADTPGYYIKFILGENEVEKWKAWKSKAAARQFLSDLVYRRKKETGYDVNYSLIEIKPMTKKEFENRNK